ncbi:hypothetical protein DICVIV_08601 [Dictyocaulus viviparus]|uniref:Uncharacterized protein n=1 Tax=Dictyocaulus viviparus TaxID=29172 RepID=A0A0D8XLF1_DICVI|nr:hypothetical protein DICVIV_08601 [Dictyocaulus viviparus]
MLSDEENDVSKWIFVSDIQREVICKNHSSLFTFPKDAIYDEMVKLLLRTTFRNSSCSSFTTADGEKHNGSSPVFVFNNVLTKNVDKNEATIVLSMEPKTTNSRNNGFVENLRLFLKFANEISDISFIYDPFDTNTLVSLSEYSLNTGTQIQPSLGKWTFNGKIAEITVHIKEAYEEDTVYHRYSWQNREVMLIS